MNQNFVKGCRNLNNKSEISQIKDKDVKAEISKSGVCLHTLSKEEFWIYSSNRKVQCKPGEGLSIAIDKRGNSKKREDKI